MSESRAKSRRILVLPRPVVRDALSATATADLLTTDIGCFSHADWHSKERAGGAEQMIVIYCVAGRGWTRLGGAEHSIDAGQVLVIAPFQPHAYGSSPDAPWTIYWLHVAGKKVPALHCLLTDDGSRPIFDAGEDPDAIALFEEIFHMLRQSYGAEHLLLSGLSSGRLLGRLIHLHREHPELLGAKERVLRTIRYMEQRARHRVTVPELARLANLSRSHYAAVFRRQTGYPVLDYFNRLKMQRAAYLLDTGVMPVKSIAAELGYPDPLYFSRQFHRVYDVSPTQYRLVKKG